MEDFALMVLPSGELQPSVRSGSCHAEMQSCAVGMPCAMAQCTGMLSWAMAQCKLEPVKCIEVVKGCSS